MKSATENLQTRVSEIEIVMLPSISFDVEKTQQNVLKILQFQESFESLCSKIDRLASLVSHVKANLDVLETQVDVAAEDLRIKRVDYKPMSVFKNYTDLQKHKLRRSDGNKQIEPPEIFKASDYFHSNN